MEKSFEERVNELITRRLAEWEREVVEKVHGALSDAEYEKLSREMEEH